MPAEEPSVQKQLALLKEAFGAKISERILEIENAAAPLTGDMRAEEEAMRAIDTLQALSHKLTGSAGTFGFGEISIAARNLEQYCGSRKDTMPTSEDCREILGLIGQLVSVANLREEEPDDAPVTTDPLIEAEKNMPDPVVLYFGDSAVADNELKQRFSDFSFRIRHRDKSSLDHPEDCADVFAALVDLEILPNGRMQKSGSFKRSVHAIQRQ
ncbi:MAG: Hpt domain-containing protein [Rickettsiales bacterium]